MSDPRAEACPMCGQPTDGFLHLSREQIAALVLVLEPRVQYWRERAERAERAEAAPPPEAGLRITGRDVHREWRDGMLGQGREVAPERMNWDTLDQRDRDLDDLIAARLAALPVSPADPEEAPNE